MNLRQGHRIDIAPKDGKWIAKNEATGEEFEYDPFGGMLPPVVGKQPRATLRIKSIDHERKIVTFGSE
jgi:hypothetical protein